MLEATGNAMAVVRVLSPYVARVIMANPVQVKAIAHAHVKTDKIDAGVLASLHAAGFLPEVWLPDGETQRRRRLVARRNQVVRHRTRVKNETHGILAAHLVPPCPHAELFNGPGRAWLAGQVLPDDERAAIERHPRELDRLGEDLAVLDHEIAEATVDDPAGRRLLTVAGINVTVAAGLVAAIGDIRRFSSPQKLVSYFGLNPRVRQSGLGFAQHGRISKIGPVARPGDAGRGGSGGGQGAWPLARVLCAHPKPPRSSDRRGRDRTQDGDPGLAPARQGRRLSLGASGARRAQAAGTRTPVRQAHSRVVIIDLEKAAVKRCQVA